MIRRVVFDTSSLVSAAIRPGGIPDQVYTRAIGSSELCTSSQHLTELEQVLRREHFNRYVSLDSRLNFLQIFSENAKVFVVPTATFETLRDICRDANDQFVLALAVTAQAGLIVSSDNDLLVLHPWRSIQILTPRQYLESY